MGLLWIPLTIGVQLLSLYTFLGGPQVLLARFAGQGELISEHDWHRLQFGLPLALVLAFPSLLILAVLEKWLDQIGLAEIALAQGLTLAFLLRWPKPHHRIMSDEAPTETSTSESMSACGEGGASGLDGATIQIPTALLASTTLTKCGEFAIQPNVIPASPTFRVPKPSLSASTPSRNLPPRPPLLGQLKKIYMWADIGLNRPYVEARRLPVSKLVSREDIAVLGQEHFKKLRAIARTTISSTQLGDAKYDAEAFSPELVFNMCDYHFDIMRRLVYSAVFDHDRMFIDHTDVELCGHDQLLRLYRLALLETKAAQLQRPRSAPTH